MAVNFVFLTDSHHYPGAPRDYAAPKMLTRSREVLDAVVPAVNALAPDFILHGGDLVCGGSSFDLPAETYRRSIADVADAFSGFRAPAFFVPGNHDCDARTGSFQPFAERFPLPGPLTVVEPAPGVRVALANVYHASSPIEDGNGVWTGRLDDALREAAAGALCDRCPLILVLHTWVLPEYEPGKGVVGNADALVRTLADSPAVVAVFTGHRHVNRIRAYRDFLVIDTACLIGFPMGFRRILLRGDGTLVTTFHPLDLPDLIRASSERSTPEANDRWQGQVHDRDTEVLLPRLRVLWT